MIVMVALMGVSKLILLLTIPNGSRFALLSKKKSKKGTVYTFIIELDDSFEIWGNWRNVV